MTRQQVFDKVAIHLLTQRKKAFCDDPANVRWCVYHRKDGLKCAVGCLIPDEQYDPSIDTGGLSISDIALKFPQVVEGTPIEIEDNWSMLSDMQAIHDGRAVDSWTRDLAVCARSYKLSVGAVCEAHPADAEKMRLAARESAL